MGAVSEPKTGMNWTRSAPWPVRRLSYQADVVRSNSRTECGELQGPFPEKQDDRIENNRTTGDQLVAVR
ncbi:hypothetical protein D3C85_957080 [compost metagenome]